MNTRDRRPFAHAVLFFCILAACGQKENAATTSQLGEKHQGQFHLGPVEFHGSFWNSCGPYVAEVETAAGSQLAGLGLTFNGAGQLCDACILVQTAKGKSTVARVITTGTTNSPNDIDVSSAAYSKLNSGEYPREMTWELTPCAASGNIAFQFQTGAHRDWTSLWVRNPKLPVSKLEVKSARHSDWHALTRGNDGTFTDASGFGTGAFTLRVTSIDGQQRTETFSGFSAGQLIWSSQQF